MKLFKCEIEEKRFSKGPCLYQKGGVTSKNQTCPRCNYYNTVISPPKKVLKSNRPKRPKEVKSQKRVLEEYFRNIMDQFEYWEGDLISGFQFKEMERIAGKEFNPSIRKVIIETKEETIRLIEKYIHSLRYKKGGVRRQKVPLNFAVGNLITIWEVVTGERVRFRIVRGKHSVGKVFDFIKYFLHNCLYTRVMLFPKEWQEDSLFPDIAEPTLISLWSDVSIIKSIRKDPIRKS